VSVHDISSVCYAAGAGLGIASFWAPRLTGLAVCAVALGLLLIGR
jgi:uncharacterized protein (DUF2062 family)